MLHRVVLLVLIIVMAVLIRTQALLIVLAEVLVMVIELGRHRYQKKFSISLLTSHISFKLVSGFLVLYLLLSFTILKASSAYNTFYAGLFSGYYGGFFSSLLSNLYYLIDLMISFLHYKTESSFLMILNTILKLSAFLLALTGVVFRFRRIEIVSRIFLVLMCLMILLLPAKQGLRYLLPVLPLYLLLIYYGAVFVSQKINRPMPAMAVIIFTGLFLISGKENFNALPYQADWTPYSKEDSLCFAYIKQHVNDDDAIVFTKPRALTLYTGKKTINIAWQVSVEENRKKFDAVGVEYFLDKEGLNENYIRKYLNESNTETDSLKIGKVYTLFRKKEK